MCLKGMCQAQWKGGATIHCQYQMFTIAWWCGVYDIFSIISTTDNNCAGALVRPIPRVSPPQVVVEDDLSQPTKQTKTNRRKAAAAAVNVGSDPVLRDGFKNR